MQYRCISGDAGAIWLECTPIESDHINRMTSKSLKVYQSDSNQFDETLRSCPSSGGYLHKFETMQIRKIADKMFRIDTGGLGVICGRCRRLSFKGS